VRFAALLLLAVPTSASAADLVDAQAGYRLSVPPGWTSADSPGGRDEVLATWTHEESDQVFIIARLPGSTDGAWDADPGYFAAVEAGIKKQFPTYQRLSSRRLILGKKKIPALDLWFRAERDGKKIVVGARFLFLRGRSLSLVVDGPINKRPPKRLLDSFVPIE
jgi:hypothetical protein